MAAQMDAAETLRLVQTDDLRSILLIVEMDQCLHFSQGMTEEIPRQ
jgi:hypothetical protein